jgi:two-component system KDP operon response regulator KdpE
MPTPLPPGGAASKPTVLVIDDEPQLRKFVRISLDGHGYAIVEAENGTLGLREAAAYSPDLIVLDLGLPDMDGMEVLRRIREWSSVPIIVVSARGQEVSKVNALDEGADDYLTKPFGAGELLARIRVALRHAAHVRDGSSQTHTVGGLKVDLAARIVTVDDQEVHLTPIEYRLLTTLVKHAGMVVTHRQLLEKVWGPGHGHQMQYLRVYVTQLRHKLEKIPARPRYLVTEPGVGYRLKAEV